jgi:hypothetical protein
VALFSVAGFALCGCGIHSASIDNPKAYAQDFFDRACGKGTYIVLDCGAFVEKHFDGKTYEVAKANVRGKIASGEVVENVVGIVEDETSSAVCSLNINDLNVFLSTGDTSVFPKAVDLTVK